MATVKQTAAAMRRGEAIKLRLKGYSFEDIRKDLNYATTAKVRADIRQAMKDVGREEASDALDLELMRLDQALVQVMKQVEKGNLFAVDRMLAIQARRSSYLGLDAQQRDDDYSDVDRWLAGDAEVDFEIDPNEVLGEELDDEDVPDDIE